MCLLVWKHTPLEFQEKTNQTVNWGLSQLRVVWLETTQFWSSTLLAPTEKPSGSDQIKNAEGHKSTNCVPRDRSAGLVHKVLFSGHNWLLKVTNSHKCIFNAIDQNEKIWWQYFMPSCLFLITTFSVITTILDIDPTQSHCGWTIPLLHLLFRTYKSATIFWSWRRTERLQKRNISSLFAQDKAFLLPIKMISLIFQLRPFPVSSGNSFCTLSVNRPIQISKKQMKSKQNTTESRTKIRISAHSWAAGCRFPHAPCIPHLPAPNFFFYRFVIYPCCFLEISATQNTPTLSNPTNILLLDTAANFSDVLNREITKNRRLPCALREMRCTLAGPKQCRWILTLIQVEKNKQEEWHEHGGHRGQKSLWMSLQWWMWSQINWRCVVVSWLQSKCVLCNLTFSTCECCLSKEVLKS